MDVDDDGERSPLAPLLHYGSYRGRLRDIAVGAHHGAYCAGCCWALFVLLIVAGVMNLLAMVVLALVVLLEKLWSRGVGFSVPSASSRSSSRSP